MEGFFDKFRSWWFRFRNSLWFVPALLTMGAVLLALVTLSIDQTTRFDDGFAASWVFSGGAEGARGVLAAIAGTMMTVTALVFSITVVALQVAASQLTPRVLRSVMADRGNQFAIGVFIATFTYALVVLRAVHSPTADQEGFVPSLSVTVAIALALASVMLLIYFMHHSANSLRSSVVIARIARGTRGLIERLYPEEIGHPAPPPPTPGTPSLVCADRYGYLQSIHAGELFALADRRHLTIRIAPLIGAFVLPGETIAAIWAEAEIDEEIVHVVRAALVLGTERTMQSDVAFGLQQLADIALRALSPGVNDPTTAVIVTDHLTALLVLLANRGRPEEIREGNDGAVRLMLPAPTFDDLVAVAFAEIHFFGAANPIFLRHLQTMLESAAALSPAHCRAPLLALATSAAGAEAVPARDAG